MSVALLPGEGAPWGDSRVFAKLAFNPPALWSSLLRGGFAGSWFVHDGQPEAQTVAPTFHPPGRSPKKRFIVALPCLSVSDLFSNLRLHGGYRVITP